MSSHDACEVWLSPEDLVMLQEVALEGEGPEETLSRVLSECRREWMKKGRVAERTNRHSRRKIYTDAIVVDMCKNAPAVRNERTGRLAVNAAGFPSELNLEHIGVLMDICCLYAENKPLTDEEWKHQDIINSLMNMGYLMESWDHSPETPQIIPTVYCSMTFACCDEPHHWDCIHLYFNPKPWIKEVVS